ncbi:hypothetical protein [Candidatus Enterococcus mangumiae]|uniref:DUF5590 domain-containing protein n=1 Tax=Candidatus Enterococcus mangumiae TaxID=2230878 RepID=A0ABZ2SSR2_9ENTE|nr:hypothetical protein [Enterococcus sp. DIV1094]MBO0488978.1 hypothetical protein [Enterococcus sp. DIV1094]
MKKRLMLGVLVIIILGGIGGKIYMDKREKDLQELLEIQKDLANYVYNNYRLYTTNDKETDRFTQQYSNGELTTEEYVEKVVSVRKYIDINKITFTGYSIDPMNSLIIYFTVNDVYREEVWLDTRSAETDKFIYRITSSRGKGPYFIDERKEEKKIDISDDQIVYYTGGIN